MQRRRRCSDVRRPMFLLGVAFAVSVASASEVSGDEIQARFLRLQAWMQAGIDAAGYGERAPHRLDEAVELNTGRFGRSLVAARDFSEGETVFVLPTSHLVRKQDYGHAFDGQPRHIQSMLFLAAERAKGEASKWKVWIDLLPRSHDLPKYWDTDLVTEHTEGSLFPSFLEVMYTDMKREWNIAYDATGGKDGGGISWDDWKWAYDSFHTRSVFWKKEWSDEETTADSSSAFFPFFDLLSHASPHNLDLDFDKDIQAIRVFAVQPIKKGDEVTIEYFYKNSRSNSEVLQKWGFCVEDAKRTAEVTLVQGRRDLDGNLLAGHETDDQTHMDAPVFAVEQNARENAGVAFIATLRARANQGAFHIEGLPEGWWGVPDPRNGWAFFWKPDGNEVVWFKPGDPEAEKKGPTMTPATTWGVETLALQAAKKVFQEALAKFPQTLQEDLDLLSDEALDHRVRFLVMIRRDEKQTLHWWLHLISKALAHTPDPGAVVDQAQPYLDPDQTWYTPHVEL